MPEVRLIDDEGAQVGVLKTADALVFAQERDLDLVEVAPEARPPVCRVLDYSKYKYEQAQKVKQAKKHQQQITVREIKFRPKIAEHDYDTKKHHVERFLKHKDKVKVTIMFRGREVTHPERGTMILDRLAEELSELGVVEQRPMQEGRNMTMMMAPSKAVLAGRVGEDAGEGEHDNHPDHAAGDVASGAEALLGEKVADEAAADAKQAEKDADADGAVEVEAAQPAESGTAEVAQPAEDATAEAAQSPAEGSVETVTDAGGQPVADGGAPAAGAPVS